MTTVDTRFRRAERYREKAIRTWSKERWLDMGMATITFTVHTDCQGRLIADVYVAKSFVCGPEADSD